MVRYIYIYTYITTSTTLVTSVPSVGARRCWRCCSMTLRLSATQCVVLTRRLMIREANSSPSAPSWQCRRTFLYRFGPSSAKSGSSSAKSVNVGCKLTGTFGCGRNRKFSWSRKNWCKLLRASMVHVRIRPGQLNSSRSHLIIIYIPSTI